ncbi:MAG: peptidoglycan editing factor PgeF [Acidimicrobiia bacterium]|nr:peptidoglycan editing factor PgeF [Acidimicrobiia bacterium]
MSLPEIPDGFEWTAERWGDGLRCRPLAEVAPHLFTTRSLHLRAADGGANETGWAPLAEALGVPVEALVRVRQVHGCGVRIVRTSGPAGDADAEADAIVADAPASAIAVRTADCVPVLLADPATGVVAAVHAGWRGTAAGAVRAAVEAMTREWNVAPHALIAAIGPSIGPCCYRVGEELAAAFSLAGHGVDDIGRWFQRRPGLHLNLQQANRDQLVSAGLDPARIRDCGLCTACHLNLFHSYRAEGAGTGRLAAAIRPPAR